MKDTKESIGSRVARLRDAKGWSQEDLAEKSGIPRRTVQNVEYDDGSPRLDTMLAIAAALGTTLDALTQSKGYAKARVAEAIVRASGPRAMPQDLVSGLDFVSRFANLQGDLQLAVMALVYEDPTYIRLVSSEFRAQLNRLLKVSG